MLFIRDKNRYRTLCTTHSSVGAHKRIFIHRGNFFLKITQASKGWSHTERGRETDCNINSTSIIAATASTSLRTGDVLSSSNTHNYHYHANLNLPNN